MSIPEVIILTLLVALVVLGASHVGHMLAARVETAITTAITNLENRLLHRAAATPATVPLTLHIVPAAAPIVPPVPATVPAIVPIAPTPSVPTPARPVDWPELKSGAPVPPDLLPGYKQGDPIWSYAEAQLRYPGFAQWQIDREVNDPAWAALGFVWRAGVGPFVA